MANVLISVIVQMTLEKLANHLTEEAGSIWGLKKELNKLSNTLTTIQSLLYDAEQRQVKEEALRKWLRQLKDVAYDVEDVLDEFSFQALMFEIENNERNKVCGFFPSCAQSNSVFFRRDMGRRIKDVRERLDEIAKNRADFHLRESDEDNIHGDVGNRESRQTSSLIDEDDVFGREEAKMKIIEFLMSDGALSVIPIVGMGGLGKTTLAQLVYNDERVKQHFEMRMWVCVGEEYDVRRITRAIIESATKRAPGVTELDPLQIYLKEALSGKRFLLVLDDVWSVSSNEWDVLRQPLKVGANGSKIIITTRSEEVSKNMGTVPSYSLIGLCDEDCWSLFKRCTAIEGRLGENANLDDIGREIVKKCGGLPLAIKAVGSLLRFKMEETEWSLVLKSEIWDLPTTADILPVLILSYHHLPGHVKQCFVYCSIFPKDYRFEKDKLVQLWMAEGFVQPKGWKQMEDVGSEYFDELSLRSFFQYSHNDWEERPLYKMHDLIHDLARYISGEECFRMENLESSNISEEARHSSLLCEIDGASSFQALYKASRLRTLLLLGSTNSLPYITHPPIDLPLDMFQTLKYLRVLDLSYASIKRLPSSIGNLKHLRYLDISRASVKHLPDSIAHLFNLQTLRLENCSELIELPKNMNKLINLRHVHLHTQSINFFPRLVSMPPRIGRLTSLRTLSLFVVGRESGCRIEELNGIGNLRGSICISKLENVMNEEEAKKANLMSKEFLHKLELKWSTSDLPDERVGEVLMGLQPHVNIRFLEIFQYSGSEFPSWVTDPSFSKLETLYLTNCRNCNILPPLGKLPSLKDLLIHGMHEVEQVGCEFCGTNVAHGFPALETLTIEDMPAFEQWDGVEEGDFNCLKELVLIDCPMLNRFPKLLSLASLLIRNSKELCAIPSLPSLHDLDLNGCNESVLADLSHLTSLSSLSISGFSTLKSLPEGLLQPLTTLKQLYIGDFSNLTSFPEEVGLSDLVMLERLVISNCPQLTYVGLPVMLRSFQINQLDSLKCLPKKLDCLTSLQNLDIRNCSQLHSLPAAGLPPALKSLHLHSCPLLKEQCRMVGGKDWCKIAHIPYINIDGQRISPC
ncbi:hypothetical protein MRB53_001707 [Persea americana]|uniref:Uncharacterized protein n=1 Tax=Persea americana TaxID=3435 RepID=A0ACC2MSM0_PERAE|nr:hypothetical protein MRB53_001707 [Persea americana]